MGSYTKLIYHITWGTKHRRPVLTRGRRHELYAYMAGVARNNKSLARIINGTEDHVHILMSIHQTRSVARVVADIKRASSIWINKNAVFEGYAGWQDGYAAFTVSHSIAQRIYEYIDNQEIHHAGTSFEEEYLEFLTQHNIAFKEEFVWR